MEVDRVRRIDLHRQDALRLQSGDSLARKSCRLGKRDQRDPRVAALVVRTAQRQAWEAADLLREPRVARSHAVDEAVEPRQLHAPDSADQFRRAEVPAGEARETGAAPH